MNNLKKLGILSGVLAIQTNNACFVSKTPLLHHKNHQKNAVINRMTLSNNMPDDDMLFKDLFSQNSNNSHIKDDDIKQFIKQQDNQQNEKYGLSVPETLKSQRGLMNSLMILSGRMRDIDKVKLIKKIQSQLIPDDKISFQDKFIQPFTYHLKKYPSLVNDLYLNGKLLDFEKAKKILEKFDINIPIIKKSYMADTEIKFKDEKQYQFLLNKSHFDNAFFEKKSFVKVSGNSIKLKDGCVLRAKYVGEDAWGIDVDLYFLISITDDKKLRLLDIAPSSEQLGTVF